MFAMSLTVRGRPRFPGQFGASSARHLNRVDAFRPSGQHKYAFVARQTPATRSFFRLLGLFRQIDGNPHKIDDVILFVVVTSSRVKYLRVECRPFLTSSGTSPFEALG